MVEKLLNVELKSKLKTIGEFEFTLDILKSPHWVGFHGGNLEIFRPKVEEILSILCHWKFNWITKNDFEKKH
jgi:hypothetical protein